MGQNAPSSSGNVNNTNDVRGDMPYQLPSSLSGHGGGMDSGRGQATLTKLMSLMTSSQSSVASSTNNMNLGSISTKGINISGSPFVDNHSQSHSQRSPKASFMGGTSGQRSPMLQHMENVAVMTGGVGVFHTGNSSHNSSYRDNINSHRDVSPKSTDLDSLSGVHTRPR